MIIGNFNQPFLKKDKLSFTNTALRGAQALKDCIDIYQLSEIPHKGQYLTWINNRKGLDVVWERLDKGVCKLQLVQKP